MAWQVGSDVVVRTFGNKRGVVVEVARNGRYRVQVEGVTTSCRAEDLAAPPAARNGRKSGIARPQLEHPRAGGDDVAAPAARVDLHGLRVDDAVTAVLDAIDRALRGGADRLEVVHGKGSGRIKHAVHARLAEVPSVAAFRLDPRNAGVTWVYF